MLVHQDAHQLGDGHRRMGVVDVDGHLVREDGPLGAVDGQEVAHDVLHGGGGEEVLLLQAQLLALPGVVVGIEHLGDDLGQLALLHGLDVLAAVEGGHVDALGRACGPDAQHVDHAGIVAHGGDVVGNGLHDHGIHRAEAQATVLLILLHAAAEVHLDHLCGARNLPDVAAVQPVVRHLDLIAVHQLLAEQAVLVADGAAHGRQLQGGQRVQEAGRQAAQTAVAQARLRLALGDHGSVDDQLFKRLGVVLLVHQIDHVGKQRTSHQELRAEIVDLLCAGALAHAAGFGSALHDLVAHRQRNRLVQLLLRGVGDFAAKVAPQLLDQVLLNLFYCHPLKFHVTDAPPENCVPSRLTLGASASRPEALETVFVRKKNLPENTSL